jgi:hypothetical protein
MQQRPASSSSIDIGTDMVRLRRSSGLLGKRLLFDDRRHCGMS